MHVRLQQVGQAIVLHNEVHIRSMTLQLYKLSTTPSIRCISILQTRNDRVRRLQDNLRELHFVMMAINKHFTQLSLV